MENIKEWIKLWKNLFKKIDYKNSCVVLRDYHVDNIFYLKNRKISRRIGLIDYQDSLIGHPAYDLVSLLQDVRVFLSKPEQDHLYNYYINKYVSNKRDFYIAYLILGTQRLLKIIGIFKKLANKKGKKNYIKFIPRAIKLLENNLKNSIFDDLKYWLMRNKV